MAYFETHCQLCGVPFAIIRDRRADEPIEAAWDKRGREGNEEFCRGADHETAPHGPDCLEPHLRGYSGYRVSLEEMKGCRTAQCLLWKEHDWRPEPDDQDFELEGKYFLSGVGDGYVDFSHVQFSPVRHGVKDSWPANNIAYADGMQKCGIPFHPACFEIFRRISLAQSNVVDLHGLWSWRQLTSLQYVRHSRGKGPRSEFPRSGDLMKAGSDDSLWKHIQGTEYLVANPVEIPGLQELLASCRIESQPQDHNVLGNMTRSFPKSSDQSDCGLPRHQPSQPDIFEKLPNEVRYMVLQDLQAKDIANLRLATRAFKQLPATLFRRLLLQEIPFLWEAHELKISNTEWLKLYTALRRQEFKGLRNRERIWEDVTEILRRIVNYRTEGIIVDGQDAVKGYSCESL